MKVAREIQKENQHKNASGNTSLNATVPSNATTLTEFLSKQSQSQQSNNEPRRKSFDRSNEKTTTSRLQTSNSEATFQHNNSITKRNSDVTEKDSYEFDDDLKSEIHRLQHALVDKYRGTQKLVAGSQFRTSMKDFIRCENCENREVLYKKAKDTIRSLKFQMTQLEDQIANNESFKMRKNNRDELKDFQELTSLTITNEVLNKKYNELLKQNADLERQLKSALANVLASSELSSLSFDYENRMNKLREEMNSKISDATNKAHDLELQLQSALNDLNESNKHVKDLESQLDHLNRHTESNSSSNATLLEELEKHRMSLAQLNIDLESALSSNKQLHQERTKLKDEINQLQDQRIQQENVSNARIDELSRLISLHQSQLNDQATEYSRLNNSFVNIKEKETAMSRQNEQLIYELEQKQDYIASLQAEMSGTRRSCEDQMNRLNDLIKRLSNESEQTTKALQRAISGTVKLCVVAPTVNVHVSDKKNRFQANIPRESLKQFLDDQVLSKYTFLFDQPNENLGPNGENMQHWIKSTLAEMQNSIENHINTAMKSSNPS